MNLGFSDFGAELHFLFFYYTSPNVQIIPNAILGFQQRFQQEGTRIRHLGRKSACLRALPGWGSGDHAALKKFENSTLAEIGFRAIWTKKSASLSYLQQIIVDN